MLRAILSVSWRARRPAGEPAHIEASPLGDRPISRSQRQCAEDAWALEVLGARLGRHRLEAICLEAVESAGLIPRQLSPFGVRSAREQGGAADRDE